MPSLGYTIRALLCRMRHMERLNITVDDEQEKLVRLANRMHIQPGTITRSLLSGARSMTPIPMPVTSPNCETASPAG